jgi:uncharacterized membrane protein
VTSWASTSLTLDPAWPWSAPGGLTALAGVAFVLVMLTVWTYAGTSTWNWRRLFVVLALRLAALAVACLLVLRPSLANRQDENAIPSKLILLIDASQSMNYTDEFDNLSRWDYARQILKSARVQEAIRRLGTEQKVEMVYYQGAADVRKFDAEAKADGTRTDIGQWLRTLVEEHGKETNVRGIVVITDGADNGLQAPTTTLQKAAQWRSTGTCPLTVFGVGRAVTSSLFDLAWDQKRIFVDPSPVGVKAKVTVKAYLHAPGFVNRSTNVKLMIEEAGGAGARGQDKVATSQEVRLLKSDGNEVSFTWEAPAAVGEYRVTLAADPLQGEVTPHNNSISTYLSVTKEGLSLLWVDRKRAFEPVYAKRFALKRDKRMSLYDAEPPDGPAEDWYQLGRGYDVIIIGDVTARDFSAGNVKVFEQISEMVRLKGTGLMMLGGYDTFGNSDWHTLGSAVMNLLPVEPGSRGQIDEPVRLFPTEDGARYLLKLSDDPDKNDRLFKTDFLPLDGMSRLIKKPGAVVYATREGQEPVLVGHEVGKGRVLAFAGDTTWKNWRRQPDAVPAYERFWKQVALWLARQDEIDSNAWVLPDVRRLSSGEQLGFSVGLRAKGGGNVENARFTVKVISPDKSAGDITTAPERSVEKGVEKGYFWKTAEPGEYEIELTAVDPVDTQKKQHKARARFLVYAEDLENLRPAADHEFLAKLATAGGGKFDLAEESKLLQFLEELRVNQQPQGKPKVDLWPDWRRHPPSDSASDQLATLWSSTALPCFLLFATFLCAEWFLRRRWGMV